MNIGFIGYRNSGKSTISARIKKSTNMQILNTDKMIQNYFRMEIPRIINEYGWRVFRSIEGSILDTCSKSKNTVLDLGGGVILNQSAMESLGKNTFIIYLQCSEETLLNRALTNYYRPALTNLSIREEIRQVLNERDPIYRQYSNYVINTDRFNEAECEEIIMSIIKTKKILREKDSFITKDGELCVNTL